MPRLRVCPETAREDLAELLPRFARDYRIRPWELIELSTDELTAFLGDMRAADEAAAAEARRVREAERQLEAQRR
jgi:hypothetical protein